MSDVNLLNGVGDIRQNHWSMSTGQCQRGLHGCSAAAALIGTSYATSFNSNLNDITKQGISKI